MKRKPSGPKYRNLFARGGVIYYQRRIGGAQSGLFYFHRRSTDLVNWVPWNPELSVTPGEPGYERVVIQLGPPQGEEFFRIEIPLP